jgi:hypothetical protein
MLDPWQAVVREGGVCHRPDAAGNPRHGAQYVQTARDIGERLNPTQAQQFKDQAGLDLREIRSESTLAPAIPTYRQAKPH